jgi:hypothetical protein
MPIVATGTSSAEAQIFRHNSTLGINELFRWVATGWGRNNPLRYRRPAPRAVRRRHAGSSEASRPCGVASEDSVGRGEPAGMGVLPRHVEGSTQLGGGGGVGGRRSASRIV